MCHCLVLVNTPLSPASTSCEHTPVQWRLITFQSTTESTGSPPSGKELERSHPVLCSGPEWLILRGSRPPGPVKKPMYPLARTQAETTGPIMFKFILNLFLGHYKRLNNKFFSHKTTPFSTYYVLRKILLSLNVFLKSCLHICCV